MYVKTTCRQPLKNQKCVENLFFSVQLCNCIFYYRNYFVVFYKQNIKKTLNCTCCQFLWIVQFLLSLWYSLTFIYSTKSIWEVTRLWKSDALISFKHAPLWASFSIIKQLLHSYEVKISLSTLERLFSLRLRQPLVDNICCSPHMKELIGRGKQP